MLGVQDAGLWVHCRINPSMACFTMVLCPQPTLPPDRMSICLPLTSPQANGADIRGGTWFETGAEMLNGGTLNYFAVPWGIVSNPLPLFVVIAIEAGLMGAVELYRRNGTGPAGYSPGIGKFEASGGLYWVHCICCVVGGYRVGVAGGRVCDCGVLGGLVSPAPFGGGQGMLQALLRTAQLVKAARCLGEEERRSCLRVCVSTSCGCSCALRMRVGVALMSRSCLMCAQPARTSRSTDSITDVMCAVSPLCVAPPQYSV
jgi:hypothetical protein